MSSAPATAPWILHPRYSPSLVQLLGLECGLPTAVAGVLVNRGLRTADEAQRFLQPDLLNLHDGLRMRDLGRAAERILAAIARGERIFIQGDYDVDGITSTFLLYSVLERLGASPEYRIPDRITEGYGLSLAAVEDARQRGCTLIITVDCGITAVEPVAHANALGIDVVVTDHHEPAARLPEAHAVVNPRRADCPYPFKSLAGVGVTFKLAEQLLEASGGIEVAQEYLDVVAIGTIADVMPLVDENRILVSKGLARMSSTPSPGLTALREVAKCRDKVVRHTEVAFSLAPRINASGRMGEARKGFDLLRARTAEEAKRCALELDRLNDLRRTQDSSVRASAAAMLEADPTLRSRDSIVLWSPQWHPGVIGIVASRLVEQYGKPTILVSQQLDPARGSGRGVPGLDLTAVLDGCDDLLLAHGGHASAAGVTIEPARLEAFRDRFDERVRAMRDTAATQTAQVYDAELMLEECTRELVGELDRLGPHGLENPEPVFLARGVEVLEPSAVGTERQHLRMKVRQGDAVRDAIGFGLARGLDHRALAGARVDLLLAPTLNEWQNDTRVQLKVKRLRRA